MPLTSKDNQVRSYEGLFVLNTAGKDEGVKEIIDRITGEITALDGVVDSVQKMDKRPFARVTSKKVPAGFYVNIVFQLAPESLEVLQSRFDRDDEVYRILFSRYSPRRETEPVAA